MSESDDLTHAALLSASIHDRGVWDAFVASGEATEVFEDLKPIMEAVREFYETDPAATSADPVLVRASLLADNRDPKRRKTIGEAFDQIASNRPSIANARRACRDLNRRRLAERLATGLLTDSGSKETLSLVGDFIGATSADDDEKDGWDPSQFMQQYDDAHRVPILPSAINARIAGGLLPGHHGIIFARPEVGKTALALTIACYAASRGVDVLYLGNEDPRRDLMLRSLAILSQRSISDVVANVPAALDLARGRGADKLIFRDIAPGSLLEVESLVRKYEPRLVIVDQLRNVQTGNKAENVTQRLDLVTQGIRAIGKRNDAAMISLTQAGDSARGKAVLDDGDVDNSNTGVSAGCDVLIGVGMTEEMRMTGKRMLTFCKNKLGGTHDRVLVAIDPLTLRFKND